MAQLAEVWNYTKGKYKESIYENGGIIKARCRVF